MIFYLCLALLWSFGDSSPGSYTAFAPHNRAAGQNPMYADIILTPPASWGSTTVTTIIAAAANPAAALTNGVFNSDNVQITLTGITTDISHGVPSKFDWVIFDQYPALTWKSIAPLPLPITQPPTAGALLPANAYGLVSSTPPCTFAASVAAGGAKLTLFLIECAGAGSNPTQGITLLDNIIIHVPHPYLSSNPGYSQLIVSTQATFFIAGTQQTVGPVSVANPYVTTVPELQLRALQLLEFYPGAPSQNIPVNTIISTQLNAITVTLQLGEQLQAGNTLSLQTSTIPKVTTVLNGAVLVTTAVATPNVIWVDALTGVDTASTFIPVGPACGTRSGSVNCCSQSVGTILKPVPSVFSLTAWWTTLVITLGPPGCVVPADRKFTFVIPKAYLGKNPGPTDVQVNIVGLTTGNSFPGFAVVDVRALTAKELVPQMLQRYSESNALAWIGRTNFGEPEGLPVTVTLTDFGVMVGSSSYVVGASTLAAFTAKIDTNVAGIQALQMTLTTTLSKGLTAIDPTTNTLYWLMVTANQGVFRSNVGTLKVPIQLVGVQPSACSAINALTTARGTLMIAIREAACITALGTDNSVLTLVLDGPVWLLANPAAGSVVTFDVRMFPPMLTNAPPTQIFNGPVAAAGVVNTGVANAAALMNIAAYSTVAACQTMNYQAGAVGDIPAMSIAARCTLIDSISQISPVTAGFLQCNPGATVNNAQSLVSFVKIAEGSMSSAHWPATNVASQALWPQNVGLSGTPPIYVSNWGVMFSTPMFAVVVSYPPSRANLQALGVTPSIPSEWLVAFLVKIDRITTACSVPNEENPWSFCVATTMNVASVMHFASNPLNKAGATVGTTPHSGWGRSTGAVCVTVVSDGAVAGFYTVAVSPNDDDSDGAWYAFFALFALPILCLCCLALLALLFLKKKKQPCCNAMPMGMPEPVPEVYWVNAYPAAFDAPYQPAYQHAPNMMLPPTPAFYVQ